MKKTIRNATQAPDGSPLRMHPLLWCVQHRLGQRHKSDAARVLGITPQSLYILLGKCKQRSTLVPATWARPLARFFGVNPAFLRPDLYAEPWIERDLL